MLLVTNYDEEQGFSRVRTVRARLMDVSKGEKPAPGSKAEKVRVWWLGVPLVCMGVRVFGYGVQGSLHDREPRATAQAQP